MELRKSVFYNPLSPSDFDEDLLEDSSSALQEIDSIDPTFNENLWPFGFFWKEVSEKFPNADSLYTAFQEIHAEIKSVKEKFRDAAVICPDFKIDPNLSGGISGSYFLIDDQGNRRFVIKPVDEDAGCINSEKYATPFTKSPFRDNMSLYQSAMREVLGFQVAEAIGVGDVVPRTFLGIFESDQFHDFSEGVALAELRRYMEMCGPVDKEKLCSVQEYVPNSKSLFEALHDFQINGLSDDEIAARFDQTNFEDTNILLWTTYETDGHMGNFLVHPQGVDALGNEILSLKKIDNGLAFPDKNQQLRNNLSFLPNAKRELSDLARAKIAAIDVDRLAEQFEKMGLESAVPALKKRIPILQELAKQPGITIKEINTAMSKIGKKT